MKYALVVVYVGVWLLYVVCVLLSMVVMVMGVVEERREEMKERKIKYN
jgi:heme exporter protein D